MEDPRYDAQAYDYHLPPEKIAQEPAEPRDSAKLAVLDRRGGPLVHAAFRDLPDFLDPGDLLVLNDTRVIAARVRGLRTTGGKIEFLFLRDLGKGRWETLARCNGNPRPGEWVELGGGAFSVRLLEKTPEGGWTVAVPKGDFLQLLETVGETPLPPYIRRAPGDPRAAGDRERYQTIYAARPGAAAAPTAGLHFTQGVFDALERKGVGRTTVTLHVGSGTFRPIKADDIRRHKMHAEWFTVSKEAAAAMRAAKERGGRIVAVGTTSCRVLETLGEEGPRPCSGDTDIYIRPPHPFQNTDAIVTNFHLPRTSLLVMVSAFAGRERMLAAYEECKERGYRFYSYGDAMLIL